MILQTGLSWFERWSNDETLLAALEREDNVLADGTVPDAVDSPTRNPVAVARSCGRMGSAREHLSSALEQFAPLDRRWEMLNPRTPMRSLTPPRLKQDVVELTARHS